MALASAIAATLIVALVAVASRSLDRGPDHPAVWDPRVAALAAFVEDARDLDFDHPVHVDFLTTAEYTQATTADGDDLDDEDRAELDRYAAALRALGVASGEIDLFEAYNQVADAGTLAFYDPRDQRVRVRGTELTVGLRVTLVHELTHALQDQHLDLEHLYDDDLDSGAATAYRALVEGDATRIEDAYIDEALSPEEQAAYEDELATQVRDSAESTADVPAFVSASFAVPYALGEPFVLMLANDGGNRAVDEAFAQPPDTEDDLFDPTSYRAQEEDAELDLGLDADAEVFDEGPLGSPSWYLILAERIDPKVAFSAALGWGGDAYAFVEEDDRVCVRAGFIGDSDDDEDEMRSALAAWVAALPGDQAGVMDIDGHPGFEACDPGPARDMALTGRAPLALSLPSLWGYLVADATSVLDVVGARCYAHQVIDGLTYEEIADPEGRAFQSDGFAEMLSEAFETCA